jgi:hypothetical protein
VIGTGGVSVCASLTCVLFGVEPILLGLVGFSKGEDMAHFQFKQRQDFCWKKGRMAGAELPCPAIP